MKPTPEQIKAWINAGVEARWKALESGLSVDDAPTIAEGSYARCAAWARERAIEDAAKACDSTIDADEQRRATTKAYAAKNDEDALARMRHEQAVSLYNASARKCAAAIRALKGESNG